MHAQASRTTQKIRQPIDSDAIAAIEDPTLRFFLEGEAMEKAARREEAERAQQDGYGGQRPQDDRWQRPQLDDRWQRPEDNRGQGFAGRFGNDNGATLRVRDSLEDEPVVARRGHGGAIAFAALSSLTAIGVAAWMWMTPPVRPALWWLTGPAPTPAITETTNTTPRTPEAKVEKVEKVEMKAEAQAETVPAAAAPSPVEPMAAADTTTAPATAAAEPIAPKAPAAPIIEQIPSPPVAAAAPAAPRAAAAERRSGRGEPLHGYVWSPAAQAMVATEGSAAPEAASVTGGSAAVDNAVDNKEPSRPAPSRPAPANAATANTNAAMAPASLSGPGIAAPSTGPAPDETARVPTTEPATFEPDSKATAKPSAPVID